MIAERLSGVLLRQDSLFGPRVAIVAASLALSAIGVLFVHSTTADDIEGFPSLEAGSQLVKLAVGVVVLVAFLTVHYRVLERLAYVGYGAILLVLGAVLVLKRAGGESLMRWIQLGPLNIQPSELMKVVLVLTLARYLRFRKDQVRLTGLVRPVLLTLVPMLFVVLQPDLGTSLMLPPVLVALLFVANARRKYLAAAVIAGFLLVPTILVVHFALPGVSERIMREYQIRRIEGFFLRDEGSWSGVNYQLRQSLIAFGSGGVTGKGYHEGTQNLLGYLPAKHTDFVFSVVGEEMGLIGAATVVVLYAGLVLAIFRVAVRVREPFPRLVAAGIGTLFAAQGAENLGMTVGLTPITGIPLPFVSYGGSSLVTSCLAVGIVLGIAGRNVPVVASPDLNPEEEEEILAVIDDHPAGANLFPNSPY